MSKIKQSIVNHKGLLFLIAILIFFVGINTIPLLFKKEPPKIKLSGTNEVQVLSKLPITDESGKTLKVEDIQEGIIGYAEFSIKLKEKSKYPVSYKIYLDDVSGKAVFKYDYVKVYLTDEKDKPYKKFSSNVIPSYSDLRVGLDNPAQKILYSGEISGDEVQKFKLRIWVADTYVLGEQKEEFKGKISVKTIF